MPENLQTAAWLDEPGENAHLVLRNDVQIPQPKQDEVLVRLEYTGICHSDVNHILGYHSMTANIPGHEGVGRVVKLGSKTSNLSLGQRVGIKWIASTCRNCEICAVNEVACPLQHNSGRDVQGTFQQYVVIGERYATVIPEELASELAAPLLCAGLTMFSAISKTKTKPNDWLVIFGAGGGLGHIGVQIGTNRGLKVIAIDSGSGKEALCMNLGAAAFLDFKQADIVARIKEITNDLGAHAVICTAGNQGAYQDAAQVLRNLGVLVCVGLPNKPFHVPLTPFDLIVRGLTVVGSSVGTSEEMDDLLKLASEGAVKPHVEIFDFKDVDGILQKLARYEIQGRVVLRIPS